MNISQLRRELPIYLWTAELHGFGWQYRGVCDRSIGLELPESVRVYPVAILSGPGDDDFETRWMVDDGTTAKSYASFRLVGAF